MEKRYVQDAQWVKKVHLKAKMWDGGEEGNIYLNQPVALFPLKQKPKSSSNSVNTILFKKKKKTKKQKKPKNLNSKETI